MGIAKNFGIYEGARLHAQCMYYVIARVCVSSIFVHIFCDQCSILYLDSPFNRFMGMYRFTEERPEGVPKEAYRKHSSVSMCSSGTDQVAINGFEFSI